MMSLYLRVYAVCSRQSKSRQCLCCPLVPTEMLCVACGSCLGLFIHPFNPSNIVDMALV